MKRSQLLGCAFIATLALPAAAHAQPADATEEVVDAVGKGVEVKSFAFDCTELLSKHQRHLEEIKRWKNVGSMLNLLGAGLTAISVRQNWKKGEWGAAADEGWVEAACLALGALCAPFKVGKSIGWVLDTSISAAVGSDRTLNEMWTDTLAGWVYGSGEPTPAQIEQMIARHRQKLQELQAAAKPPPPMCKVEEAKDLVAEMLEKAKARTAGQLTSSVPSDLDSLTRDAVSSADRASSEATAASAALMQQQALNSYAVGPASAPDSSPQQGLDYSTPNTHKLYPGMCENSQRHYAELIADGRRHGHFGDARSFLESHGPGHGLYPAGFWDGCHFSPPPADPPPKPPCVAPEGSYCAAQ